MTTIDSRQEQYDGYSSDSNSSRVLEEAATHSSPYESARTSEGSLQHRRGVASSSRDHLTVAPVPDAFSMSGWVPTRRPAGFSTISSAPSTPSVQETLSSTVEASAKGLIHIGIRFVQRTYCFLDSLLGTDLSRLADLRKAFAKDPQGVVEEVLQILPEAPLYVGKVLQTFLQTLGSFPETNDTKARVNWIQAFDAFVENIAGPVFQKSLWDGCYAKILNDLNYFGGLDLTIKSKNPLGSDQGVTFGVVVERLLQRRNFQDLQDQATFYKWVDYLKTFLTVNILSLDEIQSHPRLMGIVTSFTILLEQHPRALHEVITSLCKADLHS